MPGEVQVFYRKWRPQRFSDVVGQQHVATTLRNAVATGRAAHAYLFCGPRGTGKTSTARILAKALNCEELHDGEPDGTCPNCVAAIEGRMLDLIEIDAASNTGVDNIRDLREKVQFSPTSGRYKVYIIDEVHMLSGAAFNALLKTLEEPPPHVVMVLATTEAQKVPATIISRCQRFDFRRIPSDLLVARLRTLCDAEGITVESAVLDLIARVVWGGLRDAENLLEQLAVSYGSSVTLSQARELLGLGDTATAISLATAVLKGDASSALATINAEAGRGTDLASLRAGVVDALRAALLLKAGVHDAVSHPPEVVDAMQDAVRAASMEKLLHALAVFGQADLKAEPSSPLPLELAVVRAVTGPAASVSAPAGRTPADSGSAPAPTASRPAQPSRPRGPSTYRAPAAAPSPATPTSRQFSPQAGEPPPVPAAPRRELTPQEKNWETVCRTLNRTKGKRFVLGPLLKASQSQSIEGQTMAVRYTSKANGERLEEEIADAHSRRTIEAAVADAFGVPLSVRVVYETPNTAGGVGAGQSALDSKLVRAAITMGARVIDERPLDSPKP
ncbi:MAG: DNA polymerase III subunit gamma/tau [Chloroflexi bacterium]|nr:DNA polymerase III subunit gamma/tau [Chloroflexota bacterium]